MSLLFQIVLGMFLFKSYNLLFPSGALFISSVKSVLCFQSNATELQQLLLIATSSPMWQTNKCNNSTQKFISLSDAQCALGWVDFRFASPISFISYKRVSVIEKKKRSLLKKIGTLLTLAPSHNIKFLSSPIKGCLLSRKKREHLAGEQAGQGGYSPPLTDNHCAQKSLAERGGSSFWKPPLVLMLKCTKDGGRLREIGYHQERSPVCEQCQVDIVNLKVSLKAPTNCSLTRIILPYKVSKLTHNASVLGNLTNPTTNPCDPTFNPFKSIYMSRKGIKQSKYFHIR